MPWLEDQGCTLSHVENADHLRQAGTLGIPQPAPPWALEVQETGQEATSLGKEKQVKENVCMAERKLGPDSHQAQLWSQTDLESDFGLELGGIGEPSSYVGWSVPF